MRYFLDTEFIERGNEHPLTLISIGIVADHAARNQAVRMSGVDL